FSTDPQPRRRAGADGYGRIGLARCDAVAPAVLLGAPRSRAGVLGARRALRRWPDRQAGATSQGYGSATRVAAGSRETCRTGRWRITCCQAPSLLQVHCLPLYVSPTVVPSSSFVPALYFSSVLGL